jgi:hypothetical protein
VLCWCFFVFSFAYGNALADQKRYNNFRTELLLNDLAALFPPKTEEPYLLTLVNDIGFSPVVENVAVNNPVVKSLVHINLKASCPFVYIYVSQYHRFKLSWNEVPVDETMPVVFDSYYHTIRSKDNQIIVILK